MKQWIQTSLIFGIVVFLGNCHELDTLSYEPNLTPENFLNGHHWMQVKISTFSFILDQPSSTFFIIFLSGIYLYASYVFWKKSEKQSSKQFWAIGFLLTGLAAILAGTSYQALGYELKCKGREYCRWTTWFEIYYEILQNLGMNAFLVATAYTLSIGKWKKVFFGYAALNSVFYTLAVLFGAYTANRFLVSFEFLELSCLPSVIVFLFSSISGYLKNKDKMNFHLQNTWLLLIGIMISYIVYLEFGFTTLLWGKGIWFSENDVLHVGLILWVFYILKFLPNVVKDCE